MNRALVLATGWLLLGLAGCKPEATTTAPAPQEVSDSAKGEFCGMLLTEHSGPKGQIFVRGQAAPFWFASVRDTLAFLRLPEMPKNVVAIYVNDMGRARNWDQPEPGTWVDARRALYVIGSRRRGGMDTEEAVPFAVPAAAQRFAEANGGRVVRLADIPDSYIFPDQGSGT
jgi:copper chaperone NosL